MLYRSRLFPQQQTDFSGLGITERIKLGPASEEIPKTAEIFRVSYRVGC